MIVKVTQEHIEKGLPGAAFKCPIALAMNDAEPGFRHCATKDRLSKFEDLNGLTGELLSRTSPSLAVRRFISRFDLAVDADVAPFEFEVDFQ